MSLPRYLKNAFYEWTENLTCEQYLLLGLDLCKKGIIYHHPGTKVIDLVVGYFRITRRPKIYSSLEPIRATVEKFEYYEFENGEATRVFTEVEVPYSLAKKYEVLQQRKAERELDMLNLRIKLKKYHNKCFSSRSFPPTLKALILNRDNYSCKLCGRHSGILFPLGLYLEVDHITEWEDGGITELSNGQTVCSECNKGKHHAKKYLTFTKNA